MQGFTTKGNTNQKSAKNIPINLVTDWQDEHSCPTALSAYKILCNISENHPCHNNCIDVTHQTLADALKRTPQKSLCALNCLERMGFIKIIHFENEANGHSANKIELMQNGQFMRKTA